MNLSQEDQEALDHHKKMFQIRTKNLYVLEEQEAGYGALNVPTHILSQIDKLREQICEHKDEINRLETIAVQDKIPLAEVEYSVTLAEAWDTPQGYPTVVGRKRLEFARLRLHITIDRAKEIERSVRRELADERLYKIEYSLDNRELYRNVRDTLSLYNYERNWELERKAFAPLSTIIRLSPVSVIEYIANIDVFPHQLASIKKPMIMYKNRWFQAVGFYADPKEEEIEFQQEFHEYLEPDRPFDLSEWDEFLRY